MEYKTIRKSWKNENEYETPRRVQVTKSYFFESAVLLYFTDVDIYYNRYH